MISKWITDEKIKAVLPQAAKITSGYVVARSDPHRGRRRLARASPRCPRPRLTVLAGPCGRPSQRAHFERDVALAPLREEE